LDIVIPDPYHKNQAGPDLGRLDEFTLRRIGDEEDLLTPGPLPSPDDWRSVAINMSRLIEESLPENWTCPGCGRTKFETLRWGFGPKGDRQGYKLMLVRHHDHSASAKEIVDGRFPVTVVCDDCNNADGQLKVKFEGTFPKWGWSLSPDEIRQIVIARPHLKHIVDLHKARPIIAHLLEGPPAKNKKDQTKMAKRGVGKSKVSLPVYMKWLRQRATEFREAMTEGEREMRAILDRHGITYRAQAVIGGRIADFVIDDLRLVIEVDGMVHSQMRSVVGDFVKDYDLEKLGFEIVRFSNNEVLEDPEATAKRLLAACENRESLLDLEKVKRNQLSRGIGGSISARAEGVSAQGQPEVIEPVATVTIFTDGGCEPNPGRGGYGALLVAKNGVRREVFGGFLLTTNNRMEMYAAIAALEALKKPCAVDLYSDSKYLVDTMTLGWKKKKNKDLWARLDDLCRKHKVSFHWVRGHAGHPENELCDQLAEKGLRLPSLPEDSGYSAEGAQATAVGEAVPSMLAIMAEAEVRTSPQASDVMPFKKVPPRGIFHTASEQLMATFRVNIDAALSHGRVTVAEFVQVLRVSGIQTVLAAGDRGNGMSFYGIGFCTAEDMVATYSTGSALGPGYTAKGLLARGLHVDLAKQEDLAVLMANSRAVLMPETAIDLTSKTVANGSECAFE